MIEQAKFTVYLFSFEKSFWETNKNNWRSRKKQVNETDYSKQIDYNLLF